jgi:MoaA/NifB/PqqE/SkfB family radical SAM enzyme
VLKNLTLFATTRCDLKCAHCLRGYPTRHDDLPLDLLPNLLGRRASAAHSMLALVVLGRLVELPQA